MPSPHTKAYERNLVDVPVAVFRVAERRRHRQHNPWSEGGARRQGGILAAGLLIIAPKILTGIYCHTYAVFAPVETNRSTHVPAYCCSCEQLIMTHVTIQLLLCSCLGYLGFTVMCVHNGGCLIYDIFGVFGRVLQCTHVGCDVL